MKFVKHTEKDIVEVYLLNDEDKILLTDTFPIIELNEDLMLELTIQKMIKTAVKKKLIQIEELDDVSVKTLKYVSKTAELEEDFK